MSTGSREWLAGSSVGPGGSSVYGHGWKLPDKLRIVKPLEGSLTLHQWQRLAVPHLGNILEERAGVAVKGEEGSGPANTNTGATSAGKRGEQHDDTSSDLGDDDFRGGIEWMSQAGGAHPTRTHMTLTNSTIMHPDYQPVLTSSSVYGSNVVQMSSGFDDIIPSRSASRMSSRPRSRLSSYCGSESDLDALSSVSGIGPYRRPGALTFSSNIGLARVLNERHIGAPGLGDSCLSLNSAGTGHGPGSLKDSYSLTPSVMATPAGEKSFSPTGTPLNSPAHTPPGDAAQRASPQVFLRRGGALWRIRARLLRQFEERVVRRAAERADPDELAPEAEG